MSDEEELLHFGVKGMKWGVRKNRDTSSYSEDAKNALEAKAKLKKSGTTSLSNAELKGYIERMRLEKQLKELQPPGGKEKAAKFVGDFMKNVGKQQMNRVANDYLSRKVGSYMAKQMGVPTSGGQNKSKGRVINEDGIPVMPFFKR